MSARKAKTAKKKATPPIVSLIRMFRDPWRSVAMVVLVISLFCGGWYVVWQDVRKTLLTDQRYRLSAEDVQISPLPPWIRSDIRVQVLQDASLDESFSILDPGLARRIGEAFELHPWVAEVVQVRKRPQAMVIVDLIYRRPACMVSVPGGMLPVDVDGILLPTNDFLISPKEAFKYPRLVGANTVPVGPVGTRWGDARVTGAAKIAVAFGSAWQELELDRIVLSDLVEVDYRGDDLFELYTCGGTRILWGRAPGINTPGKDALNGHASPNGHVSASDKVARLVEYARRNGTLDGTAGPQMIDLRKTSRIYTTPLTRTATTDVRR